MGPGHNRGAVESGTLRRFSDFRRPQLVLVDKTATRRRLWLGGSMVLTDEQVAEWSACASEWAASEFGPAGSPERALYWVSRLALALQERLEAAEKLKCPDRSDFVALEERL